MTKIRDIGVTSLVGGDKQAYASLFYEFYAPLVLYARKYVTDPDAAEDIVQEFFCRLWEERENLTRIKAFKAYLYTSVRNRSLNYLRDKHSVSIEDYKFSSGDDFLNDMMEEEIYSRLYQAVSHLPEKCRQVFMLKLEGKSNQEIADVLQVTEETVRSQLRRGRELLHKNLTDLLVLAIVFFITH